MKNFLPCGTRKPAFLFAFLFLLIASSVSAQTWTGAVNTAWENASNWSTGVVPSATAVVIPSSPSGGRMPAIISGTYSIASLTIQTGASLTISGGTLTITASPSMTVSSGAVLTQSGGTISLAGTTSFSGTFNQTAGTALVSQTFTLASGGVINQSGTGLIHMASSAAINPTDNLIISSGATVNQSGGTIATKDYISSPGTFNQKASSALFKIYRDWKPGTGSTFLSTAGTVEFTGNASGPDFASGSRQFTNIVVDAGVVPLFEKLSGSTIPFSGNFTNYNTAALLGKNATFATFILNGSGTQTINSFSTDVTFGNITVNKASGSINLASDITLGGSWSNTGIPILVNSNGVYFAGTGTIGGTASTSFPTLGVIENGVVTMNINTSCTNLMITANTNGSSLTQSSGTLLTISNDVNVYCGVYNNGPGPTGSFIAGWYINDANATVGGDVNIGDPTAKSGQVSKIVITTGSLDISGDLIYKCLSNLSSTAVIDMSGGAGNLYLAGNLTLTNTAGTLTPGTTSVVTFDGTVDQTITDGSAISYSTLRVNKVSGTLYVASNVNLGPGSVILDRGTVNTSGTGNYSLTAKNVTLNSGTLYLNNSLVSITGNLTNNGADVVGGTTAITITGDYIRNDGTFVAPSATISLAGNFVNHNTSLLNIASLTFTGTGKTISGSVSPVLPAVLVSSGSITANINVSCSSLTLTNSASANSFTLAAGVSLTVTGDVVINQSASSNVLHALNVNASTATIGGNLVFNVTASNAGRVAKLAITTGTVTVSGNVTMNNTLKVDDAVIDMSGGAGKLYIGGDFTVTSLGTLTSGTSSTVYYNGTGAQNVATLSAISYSNLVIQKASGTATLDGALTVTNVTLASGTLSTGASNYTINLSGNWTNNGGTLSGGTSTVNLTAAGTIGGTNSTTFPALNLNATATNYTLANDNSCSSLTFAASATSTSFTHSGTSSLTVNGAVTLNQPTANTMSASWNINGGSATVSGLVSMAGTSTSVRYTKINLTTGTLNANGGISFAGTTPGNKVIDMSAGAATLNLKGALTAASTAATLTAGTAGSIFNYADNSAAQSIVYFAAGAYHNLHTNNTSASGVTLSNAISTSNVTGNFRVQSGTTSNGGFTVTLNTGKAFEVADGATYKITGTTGMVTGTSITKTFGTNSTVEYNSTSAQTVSAENYGNLILSGARTTNNVTFQPSGTIGIAGSFSPISTFTTGGRVITSSTVSFNGTSAQTIPAIIYNNLTMNNAAGADLAGNITVNSALTFTAGKITTNTYKVILPSGASVSGAGQSTGWVCGNLQKYFSTSAGGTFEVGCGLYYSPLSVAFTSGFSAGNLVAKATNSSQPNVSGSTISSANINRYWTLSLPGTNVGFSTASLSFTWNTADNYAYMDAASLKVGFYNGSTWTYPTTASPTSSSVQATGLTSLSGDYAIGQSCTTSTAFSYAFSTYCNAGTSTASPVMGNNAVMGTFSVSPATGLTVNSTTGVMTVNGATPGTYTITNRVVSACTSQSSVTVTIVAQPSATISYAGSPYCANGGTATVTRTGTTGGTYSSTAGLSITASTGAINLAASTPGTYTVTYTVAATGGCSVYTTTTSVTITAVPSATISYPGSPYCSNAGTATVTRTGTAGGTYTSTAGLSITASTGAINLAASTPGTYTVTYTVAAAGGCSAFTTTASVTITAASTASIAYLGNPFCTSGTGTPTITGTQGGTFSSTAGLVIDATTGAIDLTSSNVGTYTITYTLPASGGCAQVKATTTVYVGQAVWTGAQSTDWTNAANWSCNAVPSSSTDVIIQSGVPRYPTIVGNQANLAKGLTVNTGATLTVSGATLKIAGAVVNNGTFTASNGATVEFNGSTAQTIPAGFFAGNTVYNLVINNTVSVTLQGQVNVTNILSLYGGTLYTNGYVTLKSDASNTARVDQVKSTATNPIVGNVTVERYVPGKRKYRLIAPSVTTSTSATLTTGQESLSIWGNWQNGGVNTAGTGTLITGGTAADGFDQQTTKASLFTYNETSRSFTGFMSTGGKNTKYTPLQTGKAYYMFVYGDRTNSISTPTPNATILKATGKLAVGPQVFNTASSVPLTNTVGNYTLIGNPYACTVDWRSVQKSNVSNTIWGWDANLNSTGGYVTVTATGTGAIVSPISNLVQVSRYIQPGQGFFVQTTATNPQVVINENNKINNNTAINSNVFRTTGATAQPLMAINLIYSSAGAPVLADGAVVAFDASFSKAVNDDDGVKMQNSSDGLSIAENGALLGIDSRPMPQNNDTLYINMAKLTKPQYTLEIFGQSLGITAANAFLHDTYLNTVQPLSLIDTNRVVFTVTASDPASSNANRFRVVFTQLTTLPVNITSVTATKKEQGVLVQWKTAAETGIVRYEVERSNDGLSFSKVGEVAATKAGTYSMVDYSPAAGNNWYRIRSVESDDKSIYSKTVMVVTAAGSAGMTVSPNPVIDQQINLQVKDLDSCFFTAYLFDRNGNEVLRRVFEHKGGAARYQLKPNTKLASGLYFLRVSAKNENHTLTVYVE